MNLMKKVLIILAVFILASGIAGCGNGEEKTGEETEEEIVTEETKKGKLFLAEDLVTMEEMSEITGITIVDIKLWDNDFMGLLGGTYLAEEDAYDGFIIECYQQPYRGVADEDVEHPTIGDSIKKQYEDRKQRSEESGDLEVVEGLGQEAFYDTTFKTLYVLYNDEYYFEVTDKYSADPATKKSIAIKIAEKAAKSMDEKL